MNTNINELIYTLEKLNPKKIQEIREQNPGYSELLQSGTTLGVDENETRINRVEVLIKAEICKESNIEVIKKCEIEFPRIKKRIKN